MTARAQRFPVYLRLLGPNPCQMVAVMACPFGGRPRTCANPDRGIRLLHRLGVECDVMDRVGFALVRDVVFRENAPDDFDAFAQPAAALLARNIETREFAGHVALPQTQVETTIRK